MERAKTARAVIEFHKDRGIYIISIKRTKYNNGEIIKEYYTIPGGHVEDGETYEETLKREVIEELGIEVEIKEELLSIYNKDLDRDEKFYICSYVNGTIGSGTGPEWTNPNVDKYGKYEIVFIDTLMLDKYNLLPYEVRDVLIQKYGKI